MTFRLVGLMSLVLLLSLAAFAFLMNSYQAGVMNEVTRTVSAVGKATLQTFEVHAVSADGSGSKGPADGKSGPHGQVIYRYRTEIHPGQSPESPAGRVQETPGAMSGKPEIADEGESISEEDLPGKVGGVEPDSVGADTKVIREKLLGPAGDGIAVINLDEKHVIRSSATTIPTEKGKQVLIRLEEVRAESDPALGTVLRIPTWTVVEQGAPGSKVTPGGAPPGPVATEGGSPAPADKVVVGGASQDTAGDGGGPIQRAAGGEPGAIRAPLPPADDRNLWIASGDSTADLPLPVHRQDLLVNVPTHDFQNLFAAYRRRTLFLFLGILAVGTALSAAAAAHFTRPVRRLDAGIRRLTDGDLEVQVPERGRDEIGRLARAFNEMARRLRAGRERERDLRRREKLSALGRLAAGVAHDVRNPLHSINLTLQNLEETARPGEAERVRQFDRSVGIIREEIRRLDRLVENFLRFARSDRSARAPVDLALLARETAALVEKEAERRRVRVEVESRGGPAVIEGNMESLRSSVLNLVLNSFEAMPEGGTLTLTVAGSAGDARLEVADTGRGIPAEEQEKVFEFAYTTREDGHGMGLAMVHQVVVEDHGGRVSLQSRPGEGTRVVLAFPTGLPAVAHSGPAGAPGIRTPGPEGDAGHAGAMAGPAAKSPAGATATDVSMLVLTSQKVPGSEEPGARGAPEDPDGNSGGAPS